MMGEVIVKIFGSIWHLINRTDFKNGKLDIGKIVSITQDWDYANIKLVNFDAGYVMESTGTLATAKKIRVHLKGRAKIFIIIIAFYGTLCYWHKTKEFDKYLNIPPTA